MKYYSHNQMKEVNKEFTPELIKELKSFYVERLVDNMSTKDLVAYVMDDMTDYVNDLPDNAFIGEAKNYWEDHFEEVIDEIQDYMKCDFKKSRVDS